VAQYHDMLRMLREAGAEGVHTFTFRSQAFIGNPSERRDELQSLGHEISSTSEKAPSGRWGSRYVLTVDADVVSGDAGRLCRGMPDQAPGTTLFEVRVERRPYWDEAA